MVIHRGRVMVLVHHSRQYDISVSRSPGIRMIKTMVKTMVDIIDVYDNNSN